ncbi:hypothetical protein [Methanosarcina barkeri]|uniref:hypothetical protein n=1 Tax=Methanosarcina barkeri TaxID=2208 RepID=UPI00064E97C1|nr:hypothetical protein [Methanosarcina barkeri]
MITAGNLLIGTAWLLLFLTPDSHRASDRLFRKKECKDAHLKEEIIIYGTITLKNSATSQNVLYERIPR